VTHPTLRPAGSSTPSPDPSGSPSADGSGSPSGTPTPATPVTPTLALAASTPEAKHSSDHRAGLAIGHVTAGTGTVTAITVHWSADGEADGSQPVAVAKDRQQTTYDATVKGLTNGTGYTFTVQVCAGTVCATSDALTFAPYGAPTVAAPQLSVTGTTVTVTARPVARNDNPGTTSCTLSLAGTPADAAAPADQPVAADGGLLTYPGKPLTSYVATENCTTDGVDDDPASSTPVVTGAA
jgi:hypothetical protein